MLQNFFQIIGFLYFLISLSVSNPLKNDPCLHVHCPIGEFCQKSIDGISYNCIKEKHYVNNNHSTVIDLYTNHPFNYYEKFLTYNPCLSSPCKQNQICRNLQNNNFVCQNELKTYEDTAEARKHFEKKLQSKESENRRIIFAQNKAKEQKIKTLKAFNSLQPNLNDDDYQVLSEDKIDTHLSDLCEKKKAKFGQKLVNPLRISQYIICFDDEFIIKNCPRNLVFNTHSEKCEKNSLIPNSCFQEQNPCLNNGKCVPSEKFQYRCECPSGFNGDNCEKSDVCKSTDCGKNGVCLSIGFTNEVSHLCWCNNGDHIGIDCEKNYELNQCHLNSKKKSFALKLHPTIYVECDKTKPILKTCPFPLVFSEELSECDWENN